MPKTTQQRDRMTSWTDVLRDFAVNCTASQLCEMLGHPLPKREARLLDLAFSVNTGKVDLPPFGLQGVPKDVVARAVRLAFPERFEVPCTSTES